MIKKLIKTFILIFLTLIGINSYSIANAYTFSNGADIGWVNQLEANGISWINDAGTKQDPLQILKDHGINSIRLRVFVNPNSNGLWTSNDGYTSMLGFCDKNSVVNMAKRAKRLGFKIMIDFHYSDHFADTSRQDIPSAWKNHSFEQLQNDVYYHTYDVMNALAKENIYPEYVQVGNETNSGALWPYAYIWGKGNSANTYNWTKFINKGYDAVKRVSPASKVIIHLANGHDNALFRNIFDSLKKSNAKYDVIGMSYYPYWNNTEYTEDINKLAYNLNDMASRYNKEVMVCEVGGLAKNSTDSYNLVKAVIEKVKAVPNSKGLGVFYWEPCAASTVVPGGYPLSSCIEVFPKALKFNDSINAFKTTNSFPNIYAKYKIVNRLSGKVLNVSGGLGDNGTLIEQYSYNDWNSQKWQLIPCGNNNYIIKNVHTGKVLDILSKSINNGSSCVQWDNKYGLNQQWSFTKTWDSYYKIVNKNSSKVLDINASSTQDGASVIQWEDKNGWNQQWVLIEVN